MTTINNNHTKILYRAFWTEDKQLLDSFFVHLFSQPIIDKYDKIIIYSVFGDNPTSKEPNALYVHYSGEPFYNTCPYYDLYLVGDKTHKNVVSLPLAYLTIIEKGLKDYLPKVRELPTKTKFCCNVVSLNKSQLRNEFFQKLNNKKRVDSAGHLLNNMNGFLAPKGFQEYKQFAQQYKFQLCFENSSVDYYLTEKLLNAYYHDTIPIYWGCPQVKTILNEKAFLCLPANPTEYDVEELIDKILELDRNDELYRDMFYQPLFKDGILPKELVTENIKAAIDKVVLGL
jgi:Glycosyltransferase family 10 (fucosyltransferase) C-term